MALRVFDPAVVETFRLQAFDLFQRIKPREATKQPVTIIDLDEASLRKYGQWPWPRTRIAELITKLAQNGAIVTGFDIIFAEPDRLSPGKVAKDNPTLSPEIRKALGKLPDNEIVMASIMKQTRVVLGQSTVRSTNDNQGTPSEIKEAGFSTLGEDPRKFLQNFPDLVRGIDILDEAASGHGVINASPDVDGIYRRVPLVILVQDKIKLAFSVEVLRIATGGFSFATRADAAGMKGIVVAKNFVPTDRGGKVWPYYSKYSASKYISAGDILDGSADPSLIRGHMMLVGTSAVGLEDYRGSPLGELVPGVEIHAQVIENILTKQMLSRPSTALAIELAIILVAGLSIIVILPSIGAIWSLLLSAGFTGSFIIGSYLVFSNYRILIDPTYLTFVAIALSIFVASGNYIREEKDRRRIRSAFGQYLSPDLVDQLSESPEKLVLGGETRELSVLFSDIRGFTAISESYKANPEGLTQLMNRFLTTLSQPILDRKGTIDKYMGDAIMAFWNAPVEEKNHAMSSCKAALEMIRDVEIFNKEEAKNSGEGEPRHLINVGIGINTGTCVVGNMGSELRFDYTALGDTVNLASRLEGQSKPYGLNIILGSATAKAAYDELAVIEIDLIKVKGKNEPEHIYALLGDEMVAKNPDFIALRALNASMLSSYRNQDWKSAYNGLELADGLIEKLGINMDDYLFIYETRISEFRENPPGQSWDGVYTALSK